MRAIKEFLTLQKAKKIKKEFDAVIEYPLKCTLEYEGYSDERWNLSVTTEFSAYRKGISAAEEDIENILLEVRAICKRYYCAFRYSRYGLDSVYISIEVR